MKLLLLQVTVFALFFLVLFGLTFNLPFAELAIESVQGNYTITMLVSIALLASDIVLPVPSSVLMLLNGKLFGVPGGTLISSAGLFAATMLGYGIGRLLKHRAGRFMSAKQQERAHTLFRRWGAFAVIITRPVPLLSESVSIVAGINGMPLRTFIPASLAGCIPGALIYAYYGSISNDVQSSYLSFLLVVGIAALAFGISFLFRHKPQNQ